MKKYKHFFKTNLFLTLFLSGIFLTSCNNSVREYFEYYTDSAAIELMNLENVNGTSPSGFKSIDSNYDGNAEFILRNPKKYTLEMNFFPSEKFSEALVLASYYDQNGNWTVTQNASDPNIAQLWINKNLLNYIDNGNLKDSSENIIKAITGEITIEDSETHRPFESYDVNILVNSPPPVIRNAMFQLTSNSSGTYILCFYLPKVKGTVHECDTKKIKIGSETYYFKDTGSGVNFYTDEECNTAADSNKITTSYTNSLYPLTDDGLTFTAPASDFYPVYFLTGIQFSTNEVKYDIVLEDDFGFASSVGISNKGEKLTAVNIPDDTSYFGTDDGYYEIQLTHDGKTITNNTVSGVTIYYTVEQGGSVVASGSGASGVKVKLPSGKKNYKIKAVARKPYYVESDERSQGDISVQRTPVYYVSQSGKSPAEGALGTKASPFRTIQQAVNDITNQVDEGFAVVTDGYTINLLSNITSESTESFTSAENYAMVNITKPYKYTINGNGHTIDAKRDDTKKGRVLYAAQCTLTINDVVIRGGYSPFYGSGICLDEDSIGILNNVEITNNKMYTIEGYAQLVMGGGLAVYNECVYNSGSIHDNTSVRGGGFACVFNTANVAFGTENSKVSIYNNTVSENGGGIHYDTGSIKIINADVYDNFVVNSDETKVKNNIYLRTGKTINVGGNLSGCKIGVTTADSPSSGNTIQITTGYSDNNNLPPSKIFKSDEGYGVLMDEIDNAEAVLATGGGIIDVPSQIYDKVKIKLSKMSFYVKDTNKKINISATLDSDDIELSNVTSELYCYGEKVATYTGTEITLSSSYPADKYQLNVKAKYKGLDYSASFNISIFNKDDLTDLTSAPASGTFKLSTPESLVKISEWVESGSNLSGVTIKLDDDIVLPDNFTSIGAGEENPDVLNTFHGVFDGNGKTIHVNSVAPGCKSVFGTLYANYEAGHAIIRNLTIEGDIVTTGDFFVFAEYTNTEAIIENCVNKCNVTTTGRVAGFTTEVNNGSKVINCRNEGTLISTGGCAAGITISDGSSNCMIYNSSNSGKIISGGVDDNRASAGGICCTNFASIINCYNTGDIQGVGFTGGITGFSYGARGVSNCYNAGRISSTEKSAGGIIGSASNLTSTSYKSTTMKNCCNYGVVSCSDSSGALIGKLPSTCTLTCTSGFYMSGTSSCGIADTDDSTYAVTSYSNGSDAISSLNEWCTSNTSVNGITLKQWKVGVSNNPVFVE